MDFKTLRRKIGTQKDVAKILRISQNTISGWENGVNYPKTKDLKRIADVLGVTINELLLVLEQGKREV